jgi:glycosyltransferase involved in cell wall biosynthesis
MCVNTGYMEERPFFSIIVPAFCIEHELPDCLGSIVEQSFVSFEVLCIYDQCNDGTEDVILQFCRRDQRFHYIQGQGQGLSGARNAGLERASGSYVLFVDGDDKLYNDALRTLFSYLEDDLVDILVFGGVISDTQSISKYLRKSLNTRDKKYCPFPLKQAFFEKGAIPFVWRNCYSMRFLQEVRLRFIVEHRVAEDVSFQLMAYARATSVRFIHNKLYLYNNNRQGSLMSQYTYDITTRIMGHLLVVESILHDWQELGVLKEVWNYFSIWVLEYIFCEDLRLLPTQARQYIQTNTLRYCQSALHHHDINELPYFCRVQWSIMERDKTGVWNFRKAFLFRISRKIYHCKSSWKIGAMWF